MHTRSAVLKDTDIIYKLILAGQKEGLLLKRTKKDIKQQIREENAFVAENNNEIIGTCILDFYSKRLSEVRSLYVKPEYRKSGTGTMLVKTVFKKAKEQKVKEVMTITTKELAPWFSTHGFNKDAHNFKVALFRRL